MYEVKEFSNDEALELFCWNAFKSSQPLAGYTQLAARALDYAKGLPLALEIIGSHLNGEGEHVWKCALTNYERNMNKDIYNVLRISYDQLDYNEREMFLDIAFFFNGESLVYVEKILEACGFHPQSGMKVLEHKSFLKIRAGKIWMHDLIQGMGREIVRQESEREPGERSRLASEVDILSVLTRDTGTSKVQGMLLNMPQLSEVQWSGKALKNMVNLRILIIRKAIFSGAPEWLPNSLRVLDWMEYPSSFLPASFDGSRLLFYNLSKIHPVHMEDIPKSSFLKDLLARITGQVQSLHLKRQFTKFQNLAYLTINNCSWLKELPNISMMPQLVELRLDFCYNLVKIHDSVGRLEKLQVFTAVSCLQLNNFPAGNRLKSLKLLNLTGCRSIKNFPDVSRSEHLERVYLSDTAIDIESVSIQDVKHPFVVLPGVRIPRNFRICTNEKSTSFWITREFPELSVSFVLSTDEDLKVELSVCVGRFKAILRKGFFINKSCYVLIFRLPCAFTREDYLAVESEIQESWLQVEFFGVVNSARLSTSSRDVMQVGINVIKQCGVYVCPGKSSRNIRFSDPYRQDSDSSHSDVDEVEQSGKHLQTVSGRTDTAVKTRKSFSCFKMKTQKTLSISRRTVLEWKADDIYRDDTDDDEDAESCWSRYQGSPS